MLATALCLLALAAPPSYNLENVAPDMLGGDTVILVPHDSFGQPHGEARLYNAAMSVEPRLAPVAVALGAMAHGGSLVTQRALWPDNRPINASTSYEVHAGTGIYRAFPVRDRVEYIDTTPLGLTPLWEIRIGQGHLDQPWAIGDLKVRPLIYSSAAGRQQPMVVWGFSAMDLTALEPLWHYSPFADQFIGSARTLRLSGYLTGSGASLISSGQVVYRVDPEGNRIPGPLWIPAGDNSWQHGGHTANALSEGPGVHLKQYTREEARNWLSVTLLDSSMQVVIAPQLANEGKPIEAHIADMEAYVAEGTAWCEGIYNAPPKFLFTVQFAHQINGDPLYEEQNCRNMAEAAYAVALAHPNVAYIDLFSSMGQTYPTTDAKAGGPVWDSFVDWCVSVGITPIDWLDSPYGLHLGSRSAALNAAGVWVNVLRTGE